MGFYLGIFGGQGPNPSSALFFNGKLIAMAEEERFTRIKNAPSALPLKSIQYCLKEAQVTLEEIDTIGFGWDCEKYVSTWPQFSKNMRSKYKSYDQEYDLIYESKLLSNFHPLRIKEDLKFGLAKVGIKFDSTKLVFLNHHKCHAASSFFQSGFDESLVFCFDGSGEEISTSIWVGRKDNLELLKKINYPNSLGGFYATFTEFLGFKANSEEGKLMGLASYGEFSTEIQSNLQKILSFDESNLSYEVNLEMRFIGERSFNNIFTDQFVYLFGEPRLSFDPISKYHKDLAFNVQFYLERIIENIVENAIKETKISNVCLSGGVAMNCKLNGKLALLPSVDKIFVQPASSDNGVAIGAAILVALESGVTQFDELKHSFYGPEFLNTEIETTLLKSKVKFKKLTNTVQIAAKFLHEGKLIGWFQGRSEFGARALGNRSILASPVFTEMKDKLNLEVKNRESWRPFCPSIIEESYNVYFENVPPNPFMILAFPIKQDFHKIIPAVVHIDGTARPQSVNKNTNPKFHSLISAFGKLSGHPVLINTSFNVQGEPIVDSPEDALRCFFSTGLDKLIIGDFLVEKNEE